MIDDDSIYSFMEDKPLEGYQKIARACGEIYKAFLLEGFDAVQAFDLMHLYYEVMLDVVPVGSADDEGDE